MTTTPAFLMPWGVLPNASEKRNLRQISQNNLNLFTYTADAGFDEGGGLSCVSDASGPATFEASTLDDLTLVDGDIVYVMFQFSLITWTPLSAFPKILSMHHNRHAGNAPYCEIEVEDGSASPAWAMRVRATDGSGNTITTAGTAWALAGTGTVYTAMMAIERLTSTTAKVYLYQWTGGTWVEKETASGTFTWSSVVWKDIRTGSPLTLAKGEAGNVRVSRVIPSINVIPAGTMLCDHEALVTTPDGSTYDEWVDQAAGGTVNDKVDDALGSESAADYMTSTSTAAQKTQELNVAAVSGITDTIRGLLVSCGVSAIPATANATAYMATRLSGTDSTFLDAYFGDSAWDTSGGLYQEKDCARFFEKDPSGAGWTQTNVNSATSVWRKVATGAAEEWRVDSVVRQVLHGEVWTPKSMVPVHSGARLWRQMHARSYDRWRTREDATTRCQCRVSRSRPSRTSTRSFLPTTSRSSRSAWRWASQRTSGTRRKRTCALRSVAAIR